jgi:thioredoxin 1
MSTGIRQAQRQIRRCVNIQGTRKWLSLEERQRTFSTQNAELVTEIYTEEEWRTTLENSRDEEKGLLVQFTATWCPPCRMIAPVVSQLAKENTAHVRFVKVDIDNKDVANIVMNHNVSSVPTFVGYSKTGSMMHAFSGADKQQLQHTVDDIAK